MGDAKTKLADVLRETIIWLRRPDNEFAWSSWNDAEWWSEYPPAWKPLVEIANEMLKAFGGTAAGE
jgi:hypothetical protein